MKKKARYNFCENLERDIQKRSEFKDDSFILMGKWKRFYKSINGLRIYEVDGEWIRNNLSVIFGHGGHCFVHEFIPLSEIWISTHHVKNYFYDCGCTHVTKSGPVGMKFFQETINHEIAEFNFMGLGKPFWKAHQIAMKREILQGGLR